MCASSTAIWTCVARNCKNLILRHNITKAVRDFLDNHGFLEIETPMLTKSTGRCQRLSGSQPCQSRQLLCASPITPDFQTALMVSGFEKYFQIARCFRDEDLRKDRQPEFTQIDIEMSFIDEEDIYDLIERMFVYVFDKVLASSWIAISKSPMPRPWRFGSDKPIPALVWSWSIFHITGVWFKSSGCCENGGR